MLDVNTAVSSTVDAGKELLDKTVHTVQAVNLDSYVTEGWIILGIVLFVGGLIGYLLRASRKS